MRKLSSSSTFFYKRTFPTLWLGGVGIVALVALAQLLHGKLESLALLFFASLMFAFGYIWFRALLFDLADEVHLADDHFVVRRGRDQEHILLSKVKCVYGSVMMNPERITIVLREACTFGKRVNFMPLHRFIRLGQHPLAKELDKIVQKANSEAIGRTAIPHVS